MVGHAWPALDDDVWELYDTNADWTQNRDLAEEQPEKLRQLQRLFLLEAAKYNVLPLDDRGIERAVPEIAGRPTLIQGERQLLFAGMGRLSENSVVNVKNKSHAITAEIDVPNGGAEGVIIAQGGSIGGWSLYLKDGKPRYCYNLLGKGGTATLYLDGVEIGADQIAGTAAMVFSADDTCDVGVENGALVADDYPVPNQFTGEVNWVEIDVGAAAEDADHQIAPDELVRVAMARQ